MARRSKMEIMEGLKGKHVLVTGGTGFVGSHLVKELIIKGAHVVIPYRSIDPRSYFATECLADDTILVSGDLQDFERIFDIVTKYEIEYIFHLGAQAIVTTAFHNPREAINTNVLGTTNILESARLSSRVKSIIVASSDKAYGKLSHPYVETDPLCGDHPYEVSKSAADLISTAYYKTYNTPVIVTRFGNIYGEGDLNYNRIVPGIMESVITHKKLHLRSDGSFIRDYIYVKDVVNGYLLLLQHMNITTGKSFNFGSQDSLSVTDVIRVAEKSLRCIIPYQIDNIAVNEIPIQKLDYTKINKAIGWKPVFQMHQVLPKICRWYKRNHRSF